MIFKNFTDNDYYEGRYEALPSVMLFLSHVIEGFFERMRAQDAGAKTAFQTRSVLSLYLLRDDPRWADKVKTILGGLSTALACPHCRETLVLTKHNMARLLLAESFRCKSCGRVSLFRCSACR